MLVMIKNELGRKPGSAFLLAPGIRKCGNRSSIHHTVIWIKMVLYFVFNLIAIDRLISKDSHRSYRNCFVQTTSTNVQLKKRNVAMRFDIGNCIITRGMYILTKKPFVWFKNIFYKLLDVADVIRPYPAIIDYLQQVKDPAFLDELVKFDGGKEALNAFHAFLRKFGMRGTGEIDITRA